MAEIENFTATLLLFCNITKQSYARIQVINDKFTLPLHTWGYIISVTNKRRVLMIKKLAMLSLGVFALTIIAAPASVSASSWNNKANQRSERIKTIRCNLYDRQQNRLFKNYDQNNNVLNKRVQFWINLENKRDCQPKDNTADTLAKNGNFKTLIAALDATDLTNTLKTANATVFAPTDQAFNNLPVGTVEALLNDIPALTNILAYHVVGGTVPANTAKTLNSATTLNGQDVAISVKNNNLFINDSRVVLNDIKTTNGIIHVIDAVLLP